MKNLGYFVILLTLVRYTSHAGQQPQTTWSGVPRTTLAERLAHKYTYQSPSPRYSYRQTYSKVPRRPYRRYYRNYYRPQSAQQRGKIAA